MEWKKILLAMELFKKINRKNNVGRTSAKVNTFRNIDKSEHDDTKHDPYPVLPPCRQISNGIVYIRNGGHKTGCR